MLSFDKENFTLVIKATDEQKKAALADFDKMNAKIFSMFNYIEKKDTPESEKDKYGVLSIIFMRTIAEAAHFLIAMGIPVEEVKMRYKF
jgi:hypothetical protein